VTIFISQVLRWLLARGVPIGATVRIIVYTADSYRRESSTSPCLPNGLAAKRRKIRKKGRSETLKFLVIRGTTGWGYAAATGLLVSGLNIQLFDSTGQGAVQPAIGLHACLEAFQHDAYCGIIGPAGPFPQLA